MGIKWTRKEYLARQCSHREFNAQFVTPAVKSLVVRVFTMPALVKAYHEDPYFNTILLRKWDALTGCYGGKSRLPLESHKLIVEALEGGTPTYCDHLCVLKEAARIAVEEHEGIAAAG